MGLKLRSISESVSRVTISLQTSREKRRKNKKSHLKFAANDSVEHGGGSIMLREIALFCNEREAGQRL